MEVLVIVAFIVLVVVKALQLDNKAATPPTKKTQLDINLPKRDRSHSYTPIIDLAYISTTKKAYLQSAKWQVLRKVILKRDNYTCQGCLDSGIPLEVHHTTYIDYQNEKLHQLVSVCRDCHQDIHDTYGYSYEDSFPLIIK